jgi:hypothetical protein
MAVTEESVLRLKRDYPGIAVLARQSRPLSTDLGFRAIVRDVLSGALSGRVLAVQVRVQGIRGGRSRVRCFYELIIDTSDLQRAIPPIWVASPPDRDIKHVNIWPAHKSFCRFAGKNLPSFCWNTFATGWSRAPLQARTLGNSLEYAKQLLNTENHDSPAR